MTDHRHHFDAKANDWDNDPTKIQRARRIADAIAAQVKLHGDERVFEFGAGTGLVSQSLAERVGQLTLADNSTGMRDVMAQKVSQGLLPSGTIITDVNLAAGERPTTQFNLVIASLVLHHIPDLEPVLEGFCEVLAEGGTVCIADLDEEDGSFHENFDGFDGHNGFNRESLKAALEGAGCRDVQFSDVGKLEKQGQAFSLFLATARR